MNSKTNALGQTKIEYHEKPSDPMKLAGCVGHAPVPRHTIAKVSSFGAYIEFTNDEASARCV